MIKVRIRFIEDKIIDLHCTKDLESLKKSQLIQLFEELLEELDQVEDELDQAEDE